MSTTYCPTTIFCFFCSIHGGLLSDETIDKVIFYIVCDLTH